jgi:hypothetical protein
MKDFIRLHEQSLKFSTLLKSMRPYIIKDEGLIDFGFK